MNVGTGDMRILLALIVLALPAHASRASDSGIHIVVDKSDRQMFVYQDQTLVATYAVALGGNPEGHKQQQGDRRTPEGKYVLDYKNPKSAYHLSIHISYPDKSDREQARSRRVPPGGDIMIHGQPNNAAFRQYLAVHPGLDWTEGCIALSNQDMDALWARIRVPVGIEIRP